jgi:glycosyltransferase involved in cell wall biosynthesis
MAGPVYNLRKKSQVMLEIANPASTYRTFVDFRYFSDKIVSNLYSRNIEYVGEVAGEEKIKFISKAKALLSPIQWDEPFGMSIIEALACGTPVVSMARGALPEIIQHGYNGFLAKNYDEFKKYMTMVDQIDPANCRKSVKEKFSARMMAQQYINRYKEVIDRSQPKH